ESLWVAPLGATFFLSDRLGEMAIPALRSRIDRSDLVIGRVLPMRQGVIEGEAEIHADVALMHVWVFVERARRRFVAGISGALAARAKRENGQKCKDRKNQAKPARGEN